MPAPLPPYWWLQPAIVGSGIIASLAAALFSISWNRRIARLRATLDLIKSTEAEPYYQGLYRAFFQYRTDADYRRGVLDPQNEDQRAGKTACLDFLNHYELVAIAIRHRILDERFYRDWMRYVVVRDWKDAAELIEVARSPQRAGDPGDVSAYVEFGRLATRWAKLPP